MALLMIRKINALVRATFHRENTHIQCFIKEISILSVNLACMRKSFLQISKQLGIKWILKGVAHS